MWYQDTSPRLTRIPAHVVPRYQPIWYQDTSPYGTRIPMQYQDTHAVPGYPCGTRIPAHVVVYQDTHMIPGYQCVPMWKKWIQTELATWRGGQCYCLEDREREASNSMYIVFTLQLFHRNEIKARSCKIYCPVSLTALADPEKLKKTSGCRLIAMLFRAPIKVLEWGAYRWAVSG